MTERADLSITVNGMKFENPFLLGSGPPGTAFTRGQPRSMRPKISMASVAVLSAASTTPRKAA